MCVLKRVFVALRAVSLNQLALARLAAADVLGLRYRLEMPGCTALPRPAEVIEL